MSLERGPLSPGKRVLSASTTTAVSSSASVVWNQVELRMPAFPTSGVCVASTIQSQEIVWPFALTDRGRSENRNNDRSFNDRGFDRGRSNDRNFNNNNNRNFNDRSFDRGRADNFRGDRGRSFDRGRSSDRGRPFFHEGRVSRYERFGSGFRVWIIGAPYPFFIPEARFRLFPHFRVGLSIRLGGYYNPLGYYDYYDGAYDGGYYDGGYGSSGYASGDLTGVVESVDYRRGTVLIRDRASDRIVSVVMRGDDPRFGDLRIGDYVELSGDWTRIGTFEAYRVYNQDGAGYRY